MNAVPNPPSLSLALSELPRATFESLRLMSGLARLIRDNSGGDGHPVLVLPGYGAADGSTAILRFFLRRIGYRPFALEAGRNVEGMENRIQSIDDATRFRERLVDLTVKRVREVHTTTSEPVSLIGWSMGELYALDASRHLPDIARLPESQLTQHVQVDSSHVAFAFNLSALGEVAAALRAGPMD